MHIPISYMMYHGHLQLLHPTTPAGVCPRAAVLTDNACGFRKVDNSCGGRQLPRVWIRETRQVPRVDNYCVNPGSGAWKLFQLLSSPQHSARGACGANMSGCAIYRSAAGAPPGARLPARQRRRTEGWRKWVGQKGGGSVRERSVEGVTGREWWRKCEGEKGGGRVRERRTEGV